MRPRLLLVLACLGLLSGVAQAGPITLSGFLNDNADTALVGSDLGPPSFGDDWEIANNVALYDIVAPFAGTAKFVSKGYSAGGADPYFTLFQGHGSSATFLGSNYDQAFTTGGDFTLFIGVPAGDLTVAMGAFANMSLAENYGSGTLGDGFTFLGGPDFLGSSYYELEVTLPEEPTPPIPEPATVLLLTSGLVGLSAARKRVKKL